jgi:hypothetical protein
MKQKFVRGVSFASWYIHHVMTWGGKVLVCALGSLVVAAEFRAMALEAGDTPYEGIVERNVFGLKPPEIAKPPEQPPPPPTKLTLTGITTILGNKRALLSAQVPNKPQDFYMLAEGQRQDEIEVLEINEAASTVKVNNHGVVQTLDFLNDGAKRQNVPVPMPSMPTAPGTPPPPGAPPGVSLPPPPNVAPTPLRTIPTRTMRIPPPQSAGTPTAPEAPAPGVGIQR